MPDATTELTAGRLLLVHAHPDDETSQTGATMAAYAAAGAAVTLVTCTLGEEGEIVVDDLSHLGVAGDDVLGEHRLAELTEAMRILGVTDFVRLGGDHRFRDSGMAYDENRNVIPSADPRQDCFWRTDLLVAADEVAQLIRDRKPHVIITYNQVGGYGHPDHIQAHRAAMYGAQLAAARSYRPETAAWSVDRIVWQTFSAGSLRDGIRRAREAGDTEFFEGIDPDGDLPPMVVADELIDCVVDGSAFASEKMDALTAHRSQVEMGTGFFANLSASPLWAVESYVLGSGTPFTATDGPAGDLFAGLDVTR